MKWGDHQTGIRPLLELPNLVACVMLLVAMVIACANLFVEVRMRSSNGDYSHLLKNGMIKPSGQLLPDGGVGLSRYRLTHMFMVEVVCTWMSRLSVSTETSEDN
jgi:hypothetical protein